MSPDGKSLLEDAARSTLAVVLSVVAHGLVGLALGVAIVLSLLPELRAMGTLEGMPSARASPGALLALPVVVANNWRVFVVVGLFTAAFPAAWVVVGKRRGVATVVHRLVCDHRAVAVGLATDVLLAGRLALGGDGSQPAGGPLRAVPLSRAAEAVRGAPRVVRLAARALLARAGRLPALRAALAPLADPALEPEEARRRTAAALEDALDPRDFAPSARPALVFLAVELALFAAVKLFA